MPPKPTHPALFALLAIPNGVMINGVLGPLVGFLLRQDGVPVPRIASIVALLLLPGTLFFLWSPVSDFWLRRKHWFVLSAAIAAAALIMAFAVKHLDSRPALSLLFAAAIVCVLTRACDGGLMSTVVAEHHKTRVAGFSQAGSLSAGALGGAGLLLLAQRWSRPAVGIVAALLVLVPALSVLRVDEPRPLAYPGGLTQRFRVMGREFNHTFLRWSALPAILLLIGPLASGAAIPLLPSIAKDYGVSGTQVAWFNGVGGSLLMAAGAVIMGFLPLKFDVRIAFALAALVNQMTLAIFLLGPPRPATYLCGTLLFLFTIGGAWALVTAVILKALGPAGASGGTRFSLLQSMATASFASMAWIDGRGYKYFGPKGLPGIDLLVGGGATVAFLAWFWWDARRAALIEPHVLDTVPQ
jgi:PAT family beta-lactamase induction signal transducer AmpG